MYIDPHGSMLPGEETAQTALKQPKLTLALAEKFRLDDISLEG
jgi:hypothetical protein